MQNEMRDRLVDLIKECHKKENDIMFGENRPLEFDEWTGIYADHLIENGVIVPPCKVGQTIYYHFQFSNKRILPFTRKAKVKKIYCTNNKWDFVVDVELIDTKEKGIMKSFHFSDFWQTVFLTKEEAEKVLKEREENV